MNEIELDILKINQPLNAELYITKINANTLYKMSKSDILKISQNKDEEYEGIQREIKPEKVKAIKKYIYSHDATFPNTIILNIKKDNIISKTDNKLRIKVTDNTFQIIDGQHRLKGFEDNQLTVKDFEVPITIFANLSKEMQARIFITINSEQDKVDPSIGFYQESKDIYYTPRKMISRIGILFSQDIKSPWYSKIKLLGKKDGLSDDARISLNTFSRKLLTFVYNDKKDFIELRHLIAMNEKEKEAEIKKDEKNKENIEKEFKDKLSKHLESYPFKKNFLWDFYDEELEQLLYKVLLNYFNAVKRTFPKDWENKDSLLTKTTGYNAMIMLFRDLYLKLNGDSIFTEDKFYFYTKKLKDLDGTINTNNYDGSGEKSSNDLYKKFTSIINK